MQVDAQSRTPANDSKLQVLLLLVVNPVPGYHLLPAAHTADSLLCLDLLTLFECVHLRSQNQSVAGLELGIL